MASVKIIAQGLQPQIQNKFHGLCFSLLSTQNVLFERTSKRTLYIQTHCPWCIKKPNLLSQKHKATDIKRNYSSIYDVFNNQPKSWLFVSGRARGKYGAHVRLELGLEKKLSGDNLDKLRHNVRVRKLDLDVDQLAKNFDKLNQLKQEREEIKAKRTDLKQQYREAKTKGEPPDVLKSFENEIAAMTEELMNARDPFWDFEEQFMLDALKLPNNLHQSTPLGDTCQVLREKAGSREAQSVNHVEAGEKHDLIRFSNVGHKAYYLKGELAVAEWSISDLTCDYLLKNGYRFLAGPEFFQSPILEGCGRDIFNTDEVLTMVHLISDIVAPLNYLTGVSPMTFAGYVARLHMIDTALPYNMFSCGVSYNKSDLPGLYGALQSTQAGLFSCVSEADVDDTFDKTVELVWKLLELLGFSMRLVMVPATDLRREERRRAEVQVFAPSLHRFIDIGHVSDFGDYVSQRLMTCHSGEPGNPRGVRPVHMISGTVVNITSLLAVWLEHTNFETAGFGMSPR